MKGKTFKTLAVLLGLAVATGFFFLFPHMTWIPQSPWIRVVGGLFIGGLIVWFVWPHIDLEEEIYVAPDKPARRREYGGSSSASSGEGSGYSAGSSRSGYGTSSNNLLDPLHPLSPQNPFSPLSMYHTATESGQHSNSHADMTNNQCSEDYSVGGSVGSIGIDAIPPDTSSSASSAGMGGMNE